MDADAPPASADSSLRYSILDRWPLLLGAVVVIAAIAVAAVLLLGGGGSSSGGPDEQAVRQTVDKFLASVAAGDSRGCRTYIDENATAMKRYLQLAEQVPGAKSTCGFVGATGDRVAGLAIADVAIKGDQATVTFEGNPTVMHLSGWGGRWVIDGIS